MAVAAQLHLAPPNHVQSTTRNLRDGFPYFSHHDSVSALSSWRPPCAAGLMQDSIFPVEDTILVAAAGRHQDLIVRAELSHMGDPGGEDTVYQWLDDVVAARR